MCAGDCGSMEAPYRSGGRDYCSGCASLLCIRVSDSFQTSDEYVYPVGWIERNEKLYIEMLNVKAESRKFYPETEAYIFEAEIIQVKEMGLGRRR